MESKNWVTDQYTGIFVHPDNVTAGQQISPSEPIGSTELTFSKESQEPEQQTHGQADGHHITFTHPYVHEPHLIHDAPIVADPFKQ